jgi:hypothetical protein
LLFFYWFLFLFDQKFMMGSYNFNNVHRVKCHLYNRGFN